MLLRPLRGGKHWLSTVARGSEQLQVRRRKKRNIHVYFAMLMYLCVSKENRRTDEVWLVVDLLVEG